MSMDKLFRSDEKLYISLPICLKKFLDEASKIENQMYNFFGTQPGTSQRVSFMKFMEERDFSSKDADQTINRVEVLHEIRECYETTAIKNQIVLRGKYFKYREQELKRTFSTSNTKPKQDIVCTVHLLSPMNRTPETFENVSLRNRCEVKFLVRGDMPLVKLRNKIFCPSDFWCNLEDHESANNKDAYFSNRFPSGFIFIHDTFYIDKRSESTDISEPIRKFMNCKKKDFNQHFIKDIADTRIIDLTIRLGQPYVYQHQGNCEHLLIFTDLRTLNSVDEQFVDEYPIRIFDTIQHKMCFTCKESAAVYVVTKSDRMPTAPAFMCDVCFHNFHYDGANRIGNFCAFHYTDRAGIE